MYILFSTKSCPPWWIMPFGLNWFRKIRWFRFFGLSFGKENRRAFLHACFPPDGCWNPSELHWIHFNSTPGSHGRLPIGWIIRWQLHYSACLFDCKYVFWKISNFSPAHRYHHSLAYASPFMFSIARRRNSGRLIPSCLRYSSILPYSSGLIAARKFL